MFNHVTEGISWIESQVKFKPKSDLDRMKEAYRLLGVDLSKIKKIHVAGTNGKGSVCSMLSHILTLAGYKVGTYTSPYLLRFNERIRLDFIPIDDEKLLLLINQIYAFNQSFEASYGESLSFFELLTLMAFIHYANEKVDVMVIEVGLGGRLDATNILNYDLSLITSIGMDHMKQLGDTLESIADNKLGILKKGNHLITTVDESLHPQFVSHANAVGATLDCIDLKAIEKISDLPLRFSYQNDSYELNLIGEFQLNNAALAIAAIHYLFPIIDTKTIQIGLKSTRWAGRMDEVKDHIYVDAAHNTHAMRALEQTVSNAFSNKKIITLFSALGDKDIKGMLDIAKRFSHKLYLTTFPDPRFIPIDGYIDAVDDVFDDPMIAYHVLSQALKPGEILILTGSLHFIGYMMGQIMKL